MDFTLGNWQGLRWHVLVGFLLVIGLALGCDRGQSVTSGGPDAADADASVDESSRDGGASVCRDAEGGAALETRRCYYQASVAPDQTCEFFWQERTCDGPWGPGSSNCDHLTCTVRDRQSCGDAPHGVIEERRCYTSRQVPFGEVCAGFTLRRTCEDGEWVEDAGFSSCIERCEVGAPSACGDVPHGGVDERLCYSEAEVEPDEMCAGITQERTCHNGLFDDFPRCAQTSCTVRGYRNCGLTPHGQISTTLNCYRNSVEPFSSSCVIESTHTRLCLDGTESAWSSPPPSTCNRTCAIASPRSCDDASHGTTEERSCYRASEVEPSESCEVLEGSPHTRTCVDGGWTAWPECEHLSCRVRARSSCDGTPHGGTQSRTCFREDSVEWDDSCLSDPQTRSCDDGAWTEWPGCEHLTCRVRDPDVTPRLLYVAEWSSNPIRVLGADGHFWTWNASDARWAEPVRVAAMPGSGAILDFEFQRIVDPSTGVDEMTFRALNSADSRVYYWSGDAWHFDRSDAYRPGGSPPGAAQLDAFQGSVALDSRNRICTRDGLVWDCNECGSASLPMPAGADFSGIASSGSFVRTIDRGRAVYRMLLQFGVGGGCVIAPWEEVTSSLPPGESRLIDLAGDDYYLAGSGRIWRRVGETWSHVAN